MRQERKLTDRSELVATYLLALFEDDPTGWVALTWLNLGEKDATLGFADYLAGWKSRCPERHRPFVNRIESLFGFGAKPTK
jgi:hypothetical protein